MDPATVISLLGVAYSVAKGTVVVGTALYKFKSDVDNFDDKSEAFVNEIKALGAACQVASQRLEVILDNCEGSTDEYRNSAIHSQQLWACLEDHIIACQKTVQGLQKVLGDTIKSDGGSTTWKKTLKQLLLYLKAFDITEARERIKSHTTSLQIVLLSIAIEVSYLIPQRIDDKFQAQLADLTEMKDELSRFLNKGAKDMTNRASSEAIILEASNQIIRSGETLYSGSTAGGSAFRCIDPHRIPNIHGWLADAHDIENDQLPSASGQYQHPVRGSHKPADSIIDGVDPSHQLSTETDQARQVSVLPVQESDDEDMSDDDIDFALHCMDDGRTAFNQNDYTNANAMLQEALKVVLELPISQRKICDTDEVRYMLAHCAFHIQDAASAKSALLAVLETASSSIPDAQRRIYDTSHMLSQACVRLGELEQARISCRSAMKGRQKLLGKSHELVHESAALMGRILELQGNTTRAGFFRTMIPESYKHLTNRFRDLNIEVPDQRRTPPSALLPLSQMLPQRSEQVIMPPDACVEDRSLLIDPASSDNVPFQPQLSSSRNATDDTSATDLRSNTMRPTSPRSYTFKIPDLQHWADAKGFHELGPLSLKQRENHLAEHELIPESRIEKALAVADDEEALKLSKARSKLKPFLSHIRFSLVRELRLAVLFSVTPVVKVLLEKGVSLDAADSAGWTMLHYAASSGSISTTELLISEGASVSAAEQRGNMSPLSIALKLNHLDICDLLYRHKANPLQKFHWQVGTPIHLACAKDVLPLVRAWSHGSLENITSTVHNVAPGLLNRDYRKLEADFGQSSIIEPRVVKKMAITPIGVAALMGSINVVNWAISKGAVKFELCRLGDTEDAESQPVSALALAAATGQTHIVHILRDVETHAGQTDTSTEALKMAILNKMEETACWLLNAGVHADEQVMSWAEKYGLKRVINIASFDRETRSDLNKRSLIFTT